jgi:hypothetical protein
MVAYHDVGDPKTCNLLLGRDLRILEMTLNSGHVCLSVALFMHEFT